MDFKFQVEKPRREYVGVMRVPVPFDVEQFKTQVEDAARRVAADMSTRYGRTRKVIRLIVAQGNSVISSLYVDFVGDKVHIRSWYAPAGPLHELRAKWKFVGRGRIDLLYKALDEPVDKGMNPVRVILRRSVAGLTNPEHVMKAVASRTSPHAYTSESMFSQIRRGKLRGTFEGT